MTIQQKETRQAIANRIKTKRTLKRGGSELSLIINDTIGSYAGLSARSKDYAFNAALHYHTSDYWATYYNVAIRTIERIKRDPLVNALMSDIKSDLRVYLVGAQTMLIRGAMQQYVDIFEKDLSADNLDGKRRAAKDILERFGIGQSGLDEDTAVNKSVAVNIYASKNEGAGHQEVVSGLDISLDALKQEVAGLEALTDLNAQVAKHSKKSVLVPEEIEEAEEKADTSRRSTRGFADDSPMEIEIV